MLIPRTATISSNHSLSQQTWPTHLCISNTLTLTKTPVGLICTSVCAIVVIKINHTVKTHAQHTWLQIGHAHDNARSQDGRDDRDISDIKDFQLISQKSLFCSLLVEAYRNTRILCSRPQTAHSAL